MKNYKVYYLDIYKNDRVQIVCATDKQMARLIVKTDPSYNCKKIIKIMLYKEDKK